MCRRHLRFKMRANLSAWQAATVVLTAHATATVTMAKRDRPVLAIMAGKTSRNNSCWLCSKEVLKRMAFRFRALQCQGEIIIIPYYEVLDRAFPAGGLQCRARYITISVNASAPYFYSHNAAPGNYAGGCFHESWGSCCTVGHPPPHLESS